MGIHTNLDTIFLTKTFVDSILSFFNNDDKNGVIIAIGSVIIHECVHIHQRRKQALYYKLFIQYWNFIHVSEINNSKKYIRKSRYNLDGRYKLDLYR